LGSLSDSPDALAALEGLCPEEGERKGVKGKEEGIREGGGKVEELTVMKNSYFRPCRMSLRHSHCENSAGSFDECKIAASDPQPTLAARPSVGC